jgi:hypothetical protein
MGVVGRGIGSTSKPEERSNPRVGHGGKGDACVNSWNQDALRDPA